MELRPGYYTHKRRQWQAVRITNAGASELFGVLVRSGVEARFSPAAFIAEWRPATSMEAAEARDYEVNRPSTVADEESA